MTSPRIECACTQVVKVIDLIPHPSNRNKHPEKQIKALAKIIARNGQRSPIVVSKLSGYITKGHGRLEAIKLLGWESCAVDYQDYKDESEEFRDRIADNEIARYGEFDREGFIDDIKNIGEIDLDFEEFGLIDFEIPKIEILDPQCDEDDTPEVPKEAKTVRGDIYELGNHRVMCGDSTIIDDVNKLINSKIIDTVYTDPPYGINLDFGEKYAQYRGKGACKKQIYSKIKNDENTDIIPELINILEIIKPNKKVLWGSNYYSQYLPPSKCWLAWYKKEDLPADTFCGTELAWTNIKRHSKTISVQWKGMIKEGESGQKRVHPTQKPVLLAEQCFNYIDSGELILDLFLGSGSTLIACEKTDRKCFGMELDEHYCDVIVSRWCKYTGKNKIKLNGQDIEWRA